MVEIADIKDKTRLKAWLEEHPREVSVWIAARAAARVLPVYWKAVLTENRARESELTPLRVLRALLISQVAAFLPTDDIRAAARAASSAARGHAADARACSADARAHSAYAAAAAADAAFGAFSHAARAASAADAASAAAHANLWTAIRTDAEQASGGTIPDAAPLWPNGPGPLADDWARIKSTVVKAPSVWARISSIVAKAPNAADWTFWLDWHDALLDGRAMLPDPKRTLDMLKDIALIDSAIWDAGPATVNPIIREIWENYIEKDYNGTSAPELEVLQAADDGIVLNYNPETDRLYQEDVAVERPDRLQRAVAKLNEVRLLIRQMGNLQGVLGSELFLIERAVDHHPDNATMVFFNAKSARGILSANIGNGSCPSREAEPVIGLLDTMLLDTQNTLLPETSVQEALIGRAEDSGLLDAPDALNVLEEAADEIAEVAEGLLAEELPENAGKAKDPYQPRSVRMTALVSTVSAIMQSWIIAGYARFKTALEELDDITGRTARISKNIVLIGGTGGVGYGALQVVTNSPKVEAAIKAIIALF